MQILRHTLRRLWRYCGAVTLVLAFLVQNVLFMQVFPAQAADGSAWTFTPSDCWAVGSDGTVTAAGIGGGWLAVNATRFDNTLTDYELSATVQATSVDSAQSEYKIGFYPWYQDANNYVVAWISSRPGNNEAVLTGKIGGAAISPEWRTAALASSFDITAKHTFVVKKAGTEFTLYVDSASVVDTAVDGTSAAAGYGLNVYNVDASYTGLSIADTSAPNTYGWTFAGGWTASSRSSVTANGIGGGWLAVNATRFDNTLTDYELSATVQATSVDSTQSEYKIGFYPWYQDANNYVVAWISSRPGNNEAVLTGKIGGAPISPEWRTASLVLSFDMSAQHTFAVKKAGTEFTLLVDGSSVVDTTVDGTSAAAGYGLNVYNVDASYTGLSLADTSAPNTYGWTFAGGWTAADQADVTADGIGGGWMTVNATRADNTQADYELSATVQATSVDSAQSEYKIGFYPWYQDANNYVVAWISSRPGNNEAVLTGKMGGAAISPEWHSASLASNFDITAQHTFAVKKAGTEFTLLVDGASVVDTTVDGTSAAAGYGLNVYNVDAVYSDITVAGVNVPVNTYGWTFSDGWTAADQADMAVNGIGGGWLAVNATRMDNSLTDYQLSAKVQATSVDSTQSEYKIGFYPWYQDANNYVVAWISARPNNNEAVLTGKMGGAAISPEWHSASLASNFDITAQHTFAVRKIGTEFTLFVDGSSVVDTTVDGTAAAAGYGLNTFNVDATFTGVSLSQVSVPVNTYGWTFAGDWTAMSQSSVTGKGIGGGWLAVNATRADNTLTDYDLSATIQVTDEDHAQTEYKAGIYPWYKDADNYVVVWLSSRPNNNEVVLTGKVGGVTISPEWTTKSLPSTFDITAQNTLKVDKTGEVFTVFLNGQQALLTTVAGTSGAAGYGLNVYNVDARFGSIAVSAASGGSNGSNYGWSVSGNWALTGAGAGTADAVNAAWMTTDIMRADTVGSDYTVSAQVKLLDVNKTTSDWPKYGLIPWYVNGDNFVQFYIDTKSKAAVASGRVNGQDLGWKTGPLTPASFDFAAWHTIKVTKQGELFSMYIDGQKVLGLNLSGVSGTGTWGADLYLTKAAYQDISIAPLADADKYSLDGFSSFTGSWAANASGNLVGDAATQNDHQGRGWDMTEILSSKTYGDYDLDLNVKLLDVGTADDYYKYGFMAWYVDSSNWYNVYIDPFTNAFTSEGMVNGVYYPWRQSDSFEAGTDFRDNHKVHITRRGEQFQLYMDGKLITVRSLKGATAKGSVGFTVDSTKVQYSNISVTQPTLSQPVNSYGWWNYSGSISITGADSMTLGNAYALWDTTMAFHDATSTNYVLSATFDPSDFGIDVTRPKYGFFAWYRDNDNWVRAYVDALDGSLSFLVDHNGIQGSWTTSGEIKNFNPYQKHTLTIKRSGTQFHALIDNFHMKDFSVSWLDNNAFSYGVDVSEVRVSVSGISMKPLTNFNDGVLANLVQTASGTDGDYLAVADTGDTGYAPVVGGGGETASQQTGAGTPQQAPNAAKNVTPLDNSKRYKVVTTVLEPNPNKVNVLEILLAVLGFLLAAAGVLGLVLHRQLLNLYHKFFPGKATNA